MQCRIVCMFTPCSAGQLLCFCVLGAEADFRFLYSASGCACIFCVRRNITLRLLYSAQERIYVFPYSGYHCRSNCRYNFNGYLGTPGQHPGGMFLVKAAGERPPSSSLLVGADIMMLRYQRQSKMHMMKYGVLPHNCGINALQTRWHSYLPT